MTTDQTAEPMVQDDVRWLSDDEQIAWRAYLDGTRVLMQALDRQLNADSDLSLTDYDLLVRLSEAPEGRLRMRDLADATLTTRSGMTRAVTRAERVGWVRRVECEDDRRGMNAELTDAGRAKLAASAPGHVGAVRENLLDLLTPEQLGQLAEIGRRIQQVKYATRTADTTP
jgi:DNA-binding MarR family transcriptional regulator